MTLLLTLNRHMHIYRDQQTAREYNPLGGSVPNISLTSATVLLVGVGESGIEAARLCNTALGMRVLGVDARRTEGSEWIDGPIRPPSEMDALLPEADYASNATFFVFFRVVWRRAGALS